MANMHLPLKSRPRQLMGDISKAPENLKGAGVADFAHECARSAIGGSTRQAGRMATICKLQTGKPRTPLDVMAKMATPHSADQPKYAFCISWY